MSYKFKINCLKFSSAIVFMLIVQFSHAQARKGKNDKEHGTEAFPALDALLSKQQKALGNHAAALVWKDTIVYKKELGEFNIKTDAPITLSSQWLTTALILVLADEGKLSLDDKVSEYLPLFGTYGKNYITIRHCLSHFTGIQSGQKLLEGKLESLETAALSYAKKEIQTNPGTEFRYSNTGMIIAGRIAEIVTKRKFDQLIKQKLLNPLTMSKTSFSTMDGSGINPSSGAKSTATDLMKFLQMLLNEGSFNGKQILTKESILEMRKIYAAPGSMAFVPKGATGFSHALGSWVMEWKEDEATVLTAPGMYGVFPVVDWCRGYAMVILPKEMLGEQNADLFIQIKQAADEGFRSKADCK
jgi:CubicO group peptidase (beta-lactamase class C family)